MHTELLNLELRAQNVLDQPCTDSKPIFREFYDWIVSAHITVLVKCMDTSCWRFWLHNYKDSFLVFISVTCYPDYENEDNFFMFGWIMPLNCVSLLWMSKKWLRKTFCPLLWFCVNTFITILVAYSVPVHSLLRGKTIFWSFSAFYCASKHTQ